MTSYLKLILAGEHLTQDQAAELLESLISPDATDAQIAALLIALAAKGETADELAGFAATMRNRSARIDSAHQARLIDTCGTGGSPVKTFNVSTAAAFVVAAAGVPVAKHGNVGVTSKAGSADVLRALGVKVELAPDQVRACLDEIGMCFMFAPLHHGATKRVAMIRRELQVRTIFNLLGPLTNPAGAPFQVIGVSDPNACERMAQAAAQLGTQQTWVVRGDDGLDEITLSEQTTVFVAGPQGVTKMSLSPSDFGLQQSSVDSLRGGLAAENASLIQEILGKQRQGAALDLVLINAAAAIHVAGLGETLMDSVKYAKEAIDSGQALSKLRELQTFSQQFAA